MERRDVRRFNKGLKEWFLELGFRMTVEAPVDELPLVEFCQMKPIRLDGGRCIMVRNIPTALIKESKITNSIKTQSELEAWLTAVGEGGLACAGRVPVLQELYQCYLRNGSGRRSGIANSLNFESGMRILSRGMSLGYGEISDITRYDVYVAWDITPEEQRALEKHYSTLTLVYDGSVEEPETLNYEF